MAGKRILDSYVQRNDIALCSRHVGYTKALAAYKTLPPIDRLAFAGDYLLNSTVGSSHYTGIKAAEQILGQIKGA
jgi:oxygen-dependent protoporphyrinogen oxidase